MRVKGNDKIRRSPSDIHLAHGDYLQSVFLCTYAANFWLSQVWSAGEI